MKMARTLTIIAAVTLLCCSGLAASTDGALKFLVMGDWGGSESPPYTTPDEVATAKGMGKVAAANDAQFVLALGDNFYTHGVKDVHDTRFQNTFENVYTSKHLQGKDFFRVVAGNHDHNGNVSAQISYSNVSARWRFDDYYYTMHETAPDGSTVDIVYIDTVILAGNSDTAAGKELKGSELPGPSSAPSAAKQWKWIESELQRSTADFLLVAGHYPVWSICEHGPTSLLVQKLKPLLEQHNVTAYLNGHDHCAEHVDEGTGLDYHTIGSAHVWDKSTAHASKVPKDSLKFHPSQGFGGFGLVAVSRAGLEVTHNAANGSILYTAPTRPMRKR